MLRPVGGADSPAYVAALAAGFEAPVETMATLGCPELLDLPGAAGCLAEADGVVVGTGLALRTGDCVGVFNVSVAPGADRPESPSCSAPTTRTPCIRAMTSPRWSTGAPQRRPLRADERGLPARAAGGRPGPPTQGGSTPTVPSTTRAHRPDRRAAPSDARAAASVTYRVTTAQPTPRETLWRASGQVGHGEHRRGLAVVAEGRPGAS
ncbi:hypothetical protein GCM10010129_77960 [Streptomyces fumigatiscleroticus]|nr:hypothetical protein GCM10010129_77960 [Streptomyces fumigatiscleroticus]